MNCNDYSPDIGGWITDKKGSVVEAAQDAIQAQNACNLSGIAHSLADACSILWDEAHRTGKGTEWVNRHPVVTMYLEKMCELNGRTMGSEYGKAIGECIALAEAHND